MTRPALPLPPCSHHWRVDSTPAGGAYPAHCLRCHAQRHFPVIDNLPSPSDLLPLDPLDTPLLAGDPGEALPSQDPAWPLPDDPAA